jgi:arylsulfatase A-like enzyme
MLPTAHGFDEFFGNLYHLNAEEEPENPDYPKDPEFKKKFGPRGVIHSFANADGRTTSTPVRSPRSAWRPSTKKSTSRPSTSWNARSQGGQALLPLVELHPDAHLHPPEKGKSEGKTGLGIYADGMTEHDGHVGQVLDKLKELGLDENTIVMYSSDNGAETFTWPDGGTTMFRGEKNTQWEGGYRVPCLIKWPARSSPAPIVNDIGAHEDMLTTFVAAAGDATAKEDLLKGRKIGETTYKVHLDGYDLGPALKGEGGMAAQGVHLLDR